MDKQNWEMKPMSVEEHIAESMKAKMHFSLKNTIFQILSNHIEIKNGIVPYESAKPQKTFQTLPKVFTKKNLKGG